MLDDAKTLLNNPKLRAPVSTGGATPLHVAAAKNYTTVIKYVCLSVCLSHSVCVCVCVCV